MTFTCVSGIHIGAREEGAPGGQRVYKTSLKIGEMLIIPATSWKGVFRAISERILLSMKLEGIEATLRKLYHENSQGVGFKLDNKESDEFKALREYIASNYESVKDALSRLVTGNSEVVTKLADYEDGEGLSNFLLEEGIGRPLLQRYLGMVYPITSLYGSQGVAGKMRFLDTLVKAILHYRPGVGIDRKTMTVREGRLYFTEFMVPADDMITLRIIIDNVMKGTTEAKLLAATLRYVKSEGIQIGGSKSKGVGHLELDDDKSHFRILNLTEKLDLDTKIRRIASPKNWEQKRFDEFISEVWYVGK